MLLSKAGRCGLLGPRQRLAASPLGIRSHETTLVAHARSRRPRSDAEQDPEEPEAVQQQQQQQPEIVRSSRGKASRRNVRETRSATQKLVTPHQALREMGIIAVDDKGKPFVDVSCLGRGKPHWYAIGLLENKEARYLEQLAATLKEYGLSFDPQALYSPPPPGDEAAAAAAQQLLESQDIVAWVPKKKMMVYSPNTDKLSERDVHFNRGTGGGTLLLHLTLSPLLFDIISNTYYFLAWRDEQLVPAMLLYQADLLPPDQELDEVYQLPEPCSPEFLAALAQWQHTPEAEDEEKKRREFYGMGGGLTFGVSERYDKDKRNLEKDEAGNTIYRQGYAGSYNNPSGWSSGPSGGGGRGDSFGSSRGSGRGGRGGRGLGSSRGGGHGRQQQYDQQYQEQYQQAKGSYDYDGFGYDSGGRGRGRGRGGGRQQQQQQQRRRQQDGGWFDGATAGGQDDSVRLQQMNWMGEMGSGRYSDDEGLDAEAEGGFSSATAPSRDGQQVGGRDDSVRQQQMRWMGEMGSGRYSDEGGLSGSSSGGWQLPPARPPAAGGAAGAAPAGSGIGAAFGGKGDAVRQRQMSYMEEMGSGRYSDEDGPEARGAGGAARAWPATGDEYGGRDDSVRQRQMDWMGEMGSGRYSDLEGSGDDYYPPGRDPSSHSRKEQKQQQQQQQEQLQQQQQASLMSEFAEAFQGLEADSDLLRFDSSESFGSGLGSPRSSGGATLRNNRDAGMQLRVNSEPTAAGPGKASYMEEDGFGWGEGGVSGEFDGEGAAAARQLHNTWKQEGEQEGPAEYGDAGFDSQIAAAAAAGDDLLLRQLSSMPDNIGSWQQQQQRGPGGRQQRQPPVARSGRRGGRNSAGRRSVASQAGVGGAEGWRLAADGPDDADGFEDGWADRMMADGNDKAGLDDVLRD